MKLLGGVCVVLVVFSELTTVIRGDLMSVFTYDYLVGLNLTERWSGGSIPDLVLDQILDLYAPVSSAVDNPLCRNHSLDYKQAVKDKKRWALQMMEASAIVPDGLMTGNEVQLGNYDGCLQATGFGLTSGSFYGQYCKVSLDGGSPDASTSNHTTEGLLDGILFVPGLRWSVCIPSSCTPSDLEAHLRTALQGVIGDVTVTVAGNACHSREKPTQLTPGDWFAIVFLTFFAIVTALSTAYDLKYSDSDSRSELYVSFSLYTNGRKLLTPSKGGGPLQAVHGIRSLSMMCITLGHIYDQSRELPGLNKNEYNTTYFNFAHFGVLTYPLAVDTFFVLSGLLVCYIFLREREKGTPINIPLYYLHRYIRLTPAFAATILLTGTLLGHAGDGPLWESSGKYTHAFCANNWWANMIYLHNYIEPMQMCLDHTWYLAADMQLYWLSPLILIPLWKWPRLWKILIGGLIGAGIVINFVVTFIFKPFLDPHWENMYVIWYFPTHMRFAPWVIGIGLGYMLHKAKTNPITMSRRTAIIGWLLCAVFILGSMISDWSLVDRMINNTRDLPWFDLIHLATFKSVFSLGVAWLILACSQGYGGPVNTFLSWSVFEVLGRVSYTLYLIHLYFVGAYLGTLRSAVHISDRSNLMFFAGVLFVSFFAAMLLSLVFEAPALIIENLLLGRGKAKKSTKYNGEVRAAEENAEGVTLVNIPETDNKT